MRTIVYNLIAIFLIISQTNFAQEKINIRIAAGVEKGSYNAIATDIRQLIETSKMKLERKIERYEDDLIEMDDSAGISKTKRRIEKSEEKLALLSAFNIEVVNTRGSVENFDLLVKKHDVQLALIQYDVFVNKQIEDIENGTYYTEDMRLFLPVGEEHIHLIVPSDSPIKKLDDLKGKKVVTGTEYSGTAVTTKAIKNKTGLDWMEIPLQHDNAFASTIRKSVDAMFFVGAAPVEKYERLPAVTKEKLRLIPITHSALNIENDGLYSVGEISPDIYKWADYSTPTYAVNTILVLSVEKQTKKEAQNIVKLFELIADNIDYLKEKGHPAWQKIDFKYEKFDIDILEDIELLIESY